MSQNFIYPDLAGGIVWSYSKADKMITANKSIKINVGFSFYHVNRKPEKYLISSKDAAYLKYVLHGDFLFRLPNSSIALAPTYLFQFQGSSKELIGGLLIKYYLENNSRYTGIIKRTCLSYGAYYRNNDAAIVNVMIDFHEQYAIGLSYDLNLSKLANASKTRGGMEVMLKLTPGVKPSLDKNKKGD